MWETRNAYWSFVGKVLEKWPVTRCKM